MGEKYFELSIPPFLSLHPVFDVELVQPYFPPLFDTSEVSKDSVLKEFNPYYIE